LIAVQGNGNGVEPFSGHYTERAAAA
jgi:hypothetical protein